VYRNGGYRDVLGLESIGSLRNEKADVVVLGFPGQEIEIHADHLCGKNKENATVIDLIEFITPKTDVGDGPYKLLNHVGITRLAFDVDDTDAIHAKLLMLCEPQSVQTPTGGVLRILTFKDPLGIVLELIEYRPAVVAESV
jgi:hypothetical protein